MKAAPMTQKPSFPLMKQGDVQNIYHLQMPRWLFTDTKYMELALETNSQSAVPTGLLRSCLRLPASRLMLRRHKGSAAAFGFGMLYQRKIDLTKSYRNQSVRR